MRTTLTLDDDLAESLRERARLHDLPFKQVVNDTLRSGAVALGAWRAGGGRRRACGLSPATSWIGRCRSTALPRGPQ